MLFVTLILLSVKNFPYVTLNGMVLNDWIMYELVS